MNEERRKVLEMLAEGRLTPQQANGLLEAIGPAQDPETGGQFTVGDQSVARPGTRAATPDPRLVVDLVTIGADAAYIRELRDLGLMDVPHQLLLELTAVRCGAQYIRQLRDAGLLDLPRNLLVQLAATGTSIESIHELRESGLLDAPSEHPMEVQV